MTIQPQYVRKQHRGNAVVLMVGTLFMGLMTSAIAVDMGYLYAEHTLLQAAADSAALAATHEMVRNSGTSAATVRAAAQSAAASVASSNSQGSNTVSIDQNVDITFGYLDPGTPSYSSATFGTVNGSTSYAFTGGYNAVKVNVRRTSGSPAGNIGTIMANLFGVTEFGTQASAIALADNRIQQISGLRPFYACQAQWAQANSDGNPANNTARIFGSNHSLDGASVAGCPSNPNGNWGFADFRDDTSGAPGNSTIGEWTADGYDGPVVMGQNYSTQPGTAISSTNVRTPIDDLIANHTVISIPLIDSTSGSGSNSQYHISQITGFVITAYRSTGAQSSRYIEGYFTQAICSDQCTVSSTTIDGGGQFKIRLVR